MTSTMTVPLTSTVNDPTAADAATSLPDYDPALPTFQVWVDGVRFASTQVPALAKAMFDRMNSSGRYGLRSLELVVQNDRREGVR